MRTPKLIRISDMLNTGNSINLRLKKSLTYPNVILSHVLQVIPVISIADAKYIGMEYL
jgi:hypothetical protein